ncbi:MAG: tyrosine-type recombinase/integrase [Candidatus Komeilibacteria bacterium]
MDYSQKQNISSSLLKAVALPEFYEFLLYLRVNNFSHETIYNYERDLIVFDNFLRDDVKLPFAKITKKTIELYKAYLLSSDRSTVKKQDTNRKNKLSSYSVNRMLSVLRSYLKYLIEFDNVVPIAPEAVKLTKTEKKHAKVAELELLIKLIEAPTTYEKDKLIAARNRTMLEMLFSTGMRISELLNLTRAQIDNTGKIFIRGKGKKERFVYLTERARKHLDNYLNLRLDDNKHLFIPYRGQNAKDKDAKVSTNYLQMTIKRYRELLGINVPTSAHSLRHGFATYLAESGANPAAIQILLGHESLDTTTRYVHASDRYAQQTHKKFHPLK